MHINEPATWTAANYSDASGTSLGDSVRRRVASEQPQIPTESYSCLRALASVREPEQLHICSFFL